MIITHRVIELANDDSRIVSLNQHIAFFMEDKETQFELVKIRTAFNKTPITVYIKNITPDLVLNNIKLFIPSGIKVLNKKVPHQIKPGEGFFLEVEINTSKSTERFIQVESKPHSVIFE